jgi:hypothetical protein
MPLIKPQFAPGVSTDISPLKAEGGWIDADKIRFELDHPQTINGWQAIDTTSDSDSANVFDSNVFDDNVFRVDATGDTVSYSGQARGALAWNDNDGNPYLAWGTGQGLFVMDRDAVVYDITPSGFTPESGDDGGLVYGSGPYGVGVYGSSRPTMWSLDNWGQNLLACSRGGGLFEWTPGTAQALTVSGAPTQIEFMFVSPERIVVLLGTTEFGGSFNPMLVRWSDQGDNTQWTPAVSNLSGEFPLSQGSTMMSGLVTRAQNFLWSDTAVYTMQFTGDVNSVFVIRAAGDGCGLHAPHAVCASANGVFWISCDNFYSFNGQVPVILPSTVRRDFFENIDPHHRVKSFAAWNSAYGEVWFHYPDLRDATNECSRYVAVNPKGAWVPGTFDRTAWVPSGVFHHPIAFGTDNKIYYHEMPGAGDDGAALEAFIESGFIDVGDGDTLYVIKRIVPDFEDQAGNVDITLKTRMWPNQAATSRGPFIATTATDKLDCRIKARQIAVRLESSDIDSFWGLGAIAFDAQESGEKR